MWRLPFEFLGQGLNGLSSTTRPSNLHGPVARARSYGLPDFVVDQFPGLGLGMFCPNWRRAIDGWHVKGFCRKITGLRGEVTGLGRSHSLQVRVDEGYNML